MEDIITKLSQLYAKIDATFRPVEGNPCKECVGCCSHQHVVLHRIGLMEMDYLTRHIGRDRVEELKDYIFKKADEDGTFKYAVCPLYSIELGGCSAYEWRPMSCRLYGRYFIEGGSVPDKCAFKESGIWFKVSDYFKVVPYAEEFRNLSREYLSSRPYSISSMNEERCFAENFTLEPMVAGEDFDDPVDRALNLQLGGELEKAYEIFMEVESSNRESPYFYYYLGNLCDEMERYTEAKDYFKRALSMKDDDSLFHFRAALDLVVLGEHEEAYAAFQRVVALNPRNAMAYGYLGYLNLLGGRLKEAAAELEKALSLDGEQKFFRFRLGLAYLGLGKGREAEEELLKVKDFEPVARDVANLLQEIEKVKSPQQIAAEPPVA